jgi:hypothetical protein
MRALVYVKGQGKKGIEVEGKAKNFDSACKTILSLGVYNTENSEDGKSKILVYFPPSVIEKISEVPVPVEKEVK